ncbi:MAG: FAD-binding oxidoreductase [Polyangiaceae bacterium]
MTSVTTQDGKAPSDADVVIVGGGIMGLSIAYHLAKDHGLKRVVVAEASYLCSGASGRNGGGIRAQWSTTTNIVLMQESLRLCRDFAREHRINTWFRQGGYLFLARSPTRQQGLEHSVKLQNENGVRTRLLTPAQAQKIVPQLATEGLLAASYNPDDAVVFPWPFVWGYAEGAARLGVTVMPFTRVTGIELSAGAVSAVHTSRGMIRTQRVVNAAGAHSPSVAALVGVQLPNHPHRHEICSSEPLKPWLGPLVADLDSGLYFSQSTRGEIVGGVTNAKVPAGENQDSSHRFLSLYSRALLRTCPILGQVKVLRQWAGLYDITPDQNPIIGSVDEVAGFYLACGFMGHGFMMAPVMGKRLAEHVATGGRSELFDAWNLRRYREGKLLSEGMIIG